jgi:hypothetical protein
VSSTLITLVCITSASSVFRGAANQLVFDLEKRLLGDVGRGREELRRIFRDGCITFVPQPGGFYIARSEILPLVLLTPPPSEGDQGGRYTAVSCAGRI